MAAAEPHRYVVVEADGTPDDVAGRVLAALTPVLPVSSPGDAAGGHDSPGCATAGVTHRARPELFTPPISDSAGGRATTAVVYDSKIATSGADPAPARFRHRRRRS
jgi:dTMP kinase